MDWIRRILDDQGERGEKQEKTEPVEGGRVNSSHLDLTIKDLSVEFEPMRLGDHLPVFGTPKEIIDINKNHPEYLNAVRTDDPKGSTESTCSDSGEAGESKQETEDK